MHMYQQANAALVPCSIAMMHTCALLALCSPLPAAFQMLQIDHKVAGLTHVQQLQRLNSVQHEYFVYVL